MTAPLVDLRSPEQLPGVSRTTAVDLVTRMRDLYADMETRLAADIARRLAAGMDRPDWADRKLEQAAILRSANQRLLDRLARDTDRQVTYAVISAYMRGGDQATKALLQLGMDNIDPFPGPEIQKLLNGPQSQLSRGLTDLAQAFPGIGSMMRLSGSLALRITGTHLPVLRWADDAYRQVISAVALSDVAGGLATRRVASQRAWSKLLDDGITGFVDRAGKRWNLATYVEMATRTGVAQAAVEGHLDRLGDAGVDLIIVSNAPQECERCRPWEGKVLERHGAAGRHTVQVENMVTGRTNRLEVAGSVDEAIAKGLMHPNCRHSLNAYLHGATKPPTNTADPDGDQARQKLRELERKVRKEKLKAAAAIDPGAAKDHERKARAIQGQIREHVAAAEHLGIFRKREREQLNLGNTRGTGPTPVRATPKFQPKPPAPKAGKAVTSPKPKPRPSNKFGDDYEERHATEREIQIRYLEKKLLTSDRDGKQSAKTWQDEIDRHPNADTDTMAYYVRNRDYYLNLTESLKRELAEVKASRHPELDEVDASVVMRFGTPGQLRINAHLDRVIHRDIPGLDAVRPELERQGRLTARSMVRLESVSGPISAEDRQYFADPAKANVAAFYRPGLRAVTIPEKWNTAERAMLRDQFDHCYTSGWWTPTGGDRELGSVLAHEYGHHIDNMMFRGDAREIIGVVGRALNMKVDVDALDTREELGRIVKDNKDLIKTMVSQYGTTNVSEFFAEVWQEWSTLGPKARPQIRAIGAVMQRLAEEGAFE